MRPLEAMSNTLRSTVCAAPGHELIGGDFAAIEARVLAWLAGQQDVLDVLADPKRDLYVEDAKAVGSDNRQLGKTMRLALGYGMGPIKFATTAAAAGIQLPLKEARRLTLLWRRANPAIADFNDGIWYRLGQACFDAVKTPGVTHDVGPFLKVAATRTCLLVQLPSGRAIRYWRPAVRMVKKTVQTVNEEGEIVEVERESNELQFFVPSRNAVDMTVERTYGGKLTENITQAVARDLLADAITRLDPLYPVVVHVHDSIASEVPEGTGSIEEFNRLMSEVPPWAPGLPVKCDVYRDRRFRG
jgi:DNA polymerase